MKPFIPRKPSNEEIGELYEELAFLSEIETQRDKLVSALQEELGDSALARTLGRVAGHQEQGASLGAIIARTTREKDRFSELLIDAASTPGDTAAAFSILAALSRRKASVTGLIISVPGLVTMVAVAVAVLGVILIKIVPQFAETFRSFGAELPALTLLVLRFSDWVTDWWWTIVAVMVAIGFSYRTSDQFRLLADRLLLLLPLLGDYYRQLNLNEFLHRLLVLRELDFLSETQTLHLSREGIGNAYLKQALEVSGSDAKLDVLVNSRAVFSSRVGRILARTRSADELERDLKRYVDVTAKRLMSRGIRNSQLLDMAIKMVLSLAIGVFLVALYLPIFMLGSVI